jgi:hypothetical protein
MSHKSEGNIFFFNSKKIRYYINGENKTLIISSCNHWCEIIKIEITSSKKQEFMLTYLLNDTFQLYCFNQRVHANDFDMKSHFNHENVNESITLFV